MVNRIHDLDSYDLHRCHDSGCVKSFQFPKLFGCYFDGLYKEPVRMCATYAMNIRSDLAVRDDGQLTRLQALFDEICPPLQISSRMSD